MALGNPIIGTSTPWFSQYESGPFETLLQRIPDNQDNQITAKDVRDTTWTLYNYIKDLEAISVTQSTNLYTLGTPSTISLGGISVGSTFSNISFQDLFDIILTPQVNPTLIDFSPSVTEVQFGDQSGISFNYSIQLGSESLNLISVQFPTGITQNILPIGNNPESGLSNIYNPVFTTSPVPAQYVVATMSYQTNTGSFIATASVVYKHKIYYGKINLPGGFNPNSPVSVAQVSNSITSTTIKGLEFSNLSTNTNFSQIINFNSTNQYFLFAAPAAFGFNFPEGFYVDNIFNQGFTKIKSFNFSNEFSYQTPYDVWISNNPYLENILIASELNNIGNTQSLNSLLISDSLWSVTDLATQSYTFSFLTNNQEYFGVSFSGVVDLFLPPLNDVMDGKVIVVKSEDVYTDINIFGFGSETIDGGYSHSLIYSYDSVMLIKKSNGWWII
jgi:hypothetical protein